MPASGVGRKAGGKQGVVGVKITHHNAGVSGCESKNEGQIEDSSRRPVDVIYDQWKAGEMKSDGKNINPITARDWRGDTGEVEMLFKVNREATSAWLSWAVTCYITGNLWSPGGREKSLLQEEDVDVVTTGGLYERGDALPDSVYVPLADAESMRGDSCLVSEGVVSIRGDCCWVSEGMASWVVCGCSGVSLATILSVMSVTTV